MTTRDPYIAEAAERIAKANNSRDMSRAYRAGDFDTAFEVVALADTLKELGWKPPISPELQAASAAFEAAFPRADGGGNPRTVGACLDAIERYKVLVGPGVSQYRIDAAKLAYVLARSVDAVTELCQGQDPANECWQTLELVRKTLADLNLGARA